MAIYAIGDLQGCYEEFKRLLDTIGFDPSSDTLWLTGDLVNRGPHSLATLRLVHGLGDSVVTVLGNHDLHLLAMALAPGSSRTRKSHPLQRIACASDGDELIEWLRSRPLLHVDRALKKALVHAGILPRWSMKKAQRLAAEVESALRGDKAETLLRGIYGNKPALWRNDLKGIARLRYITNVFTRMRMLTLRGGLDLKTKGLPASGPMHSKPWFAVPHKRKDTEVVFGHWSALGYFRGNGVVGLDSGCVWGRCLTAIRLDCDENEAVPVSIECDALKALRQ
ncbi:MAG: symmetrical bis(5'-nucleosyl)-tetraphosphatase [Pseudomonadota bacterium]